MNENFDTHRRQGNEGYALVFVLFLMALVIIGAATATLDQLTEGRREKEAVMIWRGKQYQRAIGLFYKKFGRFPTSVDDLVKVQNGEQRFLREAYTNPMNKDGTWRFIYVTPAGQLIGSVMYTSLQQMAFLDQQRRLGLSSGAATSPAALSSMYPGASPGNSDNSNVLGSNSGPLSGATPLGGSPGSAGASDASNSQVPPQFQPPSLSQSGQQGGSSSFFTPPGANQNNGLNVQESSPDNSDTGQVIGGFIIGVAGMKDKASIKVYKGGATYKRWEFIFNPLERVQTIGTGSTAPANPAGSQPSGTPQAPNSMQPLNPPQQPQIPQQPQ